MTLKVLDLFAGEGGASAGYMSAGLRLLAAVDLNERALRRHPGYGEGLTWAGDWQEGLEKFGAEADFIHASPPCQRYAVGTKQACRDNWPDLVKPVREALLATGKPFVIENVEQAPLENPVYLTGCMFGLTVSWDIPKTKVQTLYDGTTMWKINNSREPKRRVGKVQQGPVTFHLERKRGFEVHDFNLKAPPVDRAIHALPSMSVVGGTPTGFWNQWYAQAIPNRIKCELMGVPWMGVSGCAESIPPAYTEYIGKAVT
jgi:DNA (cytosine-5)-methyltransferase 1